jgi:hypothetical protein
VGTNGVVEEPISSELVLVDGALARRARAALPEPPWLLPVLAELEESARATPPPAAAQPPPAAAKAAPAAPAARPRRRLGAASGVSIALALAAVAVLSLAFLPLSRGPRVMTTPLRQAAPAAPVRPPAAARPKRAAPTHKATRATPKPRVARTKKPSAAAKRPRPRPTRRAAPRPRMLSRAQRVLSWRRYPSAVFYELHLQRGAETLYETRTLAPRAVLPAGLRLRPGTYHVYVRPAVPGDAGIMLGPAIMRTAIRV